VTATLRRPPPPPARSARPRRQRLAADPAARGEAWLWIAAGALALAVLMIAGLLALILVQGLGTFWPGELVRVERGAETALLGEVEKSELYRATPESLGVRRRMLRTANFDLTGTHFHWVSDTEITREERPQWAIVAERSDGWGRFQGELVGWSVDGQLVERDPQRALAACAAEHARAAERLERRAELVQDEIGAANRAQEEARIELQRSLREHGPGAAAHRLLVERSDAEQALRDRQVAAWTEEIQALDAENARHALVLRAPDGREQPIAVDALVRAYPANQLGTLGRLGVYASRWLEFLTEEPRESNSAGGVWPAIFGTVVMTLIMTLFVVPFGVLAALYLREYAKPGPLVSFVRISVNNLAGVPSIVFGVFGLGFFCYLIGSSIDELLFSEALPNPTYGKGGLMWAALTLALLTLPVVIVATEEALAAVPNSMREGSYACGATKVQTILRIVLPRALPGITTGAILAIARGAGEVAPLMLVGAAKLAPKLLVDDTPPFLHPERSFLHLGFQIFDLGFQSQNSEAAKPMVYTTTLLLIAIIVLLNLAAVSLRTRLRRKFSANPF